MTTTISRPSDTDPRGHVVTTLLDLVAAVSDVAASDVETVAVVLHLLESGRLRLLGHFTEDDLVRAA